MTNRKTYRIFEEYERELVFEDVLNEHGQIVAYKDHQSPTPLALDSAEDEMKMNHAIGAIALIYIHFLLDVST